MGWRGSALAAGFAALVACGETTKNPVRSHDTTAGSAGKQATGGSHQAEPDAAGEPSLSAGAPFEAGGAPSTAAGAPAGGEGGAPLVECDGLWVPGDFETVGQAVAAAPPGSTVCLSPGRFVANLELPWSVGLQGSPGTVLCGSLELSGGFEPVNAIVPLPQRLADLDVFGTISAAHTLDLELQSVRVIHDYERASQAGCPTPPDEGGGLRLQVDSSQRLLVEDSEFPGGGINVTLAGAASARDVEVTVRRSSCVAWQCWDLLSVAWGGSLGPGSRLRVSLENSIMTHTVLEGISFSGDELAPQDAEQSFIHVVNNTIYSADELNYGLQFTTPINVPTVVVNNAIGNFGAPLHFSQLNLVDASPNQLGKVDLDNASEWYVDAKAGDFTPAANSPLRHLADKAWLPADDFFGQPRTSADIGAVAAP